MRTAWFFALLLFVLPSVSVFAEQPNILLIMADDLGWMDLHCQGNAVLRTPNIDRLAQSGVRFNNAYAASPVCSPTRAAIITGLAPARLHITQHGDDGPQFWPQDRVIQPPESSNDLPLAHTTIAELLREAGYATAFLGKWHLGDEKSLWPTNQGFDINIGGCGLGGPPTYFDPYRIPALENRSEGEYLTDRLADEAIHVLQQKTDGPKFVCLWTYNPHYPFEAPDELTEHYVGKEGRGLKNPIYGGQIEATDRAVGRVLDELERQQIADDTLVIFTSDNGGWSGATDNRPLREGKGYLYEGGLRVPLIIRWPKRLVESENSIKNSSSNDAPIEISTPVISMDLSATILDVAGIALGENESMDGMSLLPTLQNKSIERDAIFFHYPHFAFHKANRPGAAVRSGGYKLIRWFDDDTVELYDLTNDLGETKNLAEQFPEICKQMNLKLSQWLQETDASIPTRRE